MGKLPPSMRSAPLPLSFFKPRPSPSTQTPNSSPAPETRKLRTPLYKSPAKQKKATKKIESGKAAAGGAISVPSPPQFFHSPALSEATAIVDSIVDSSSSADPHTLLHSFCNAGASPTDSLALLRHLSLRFPSFSPTRSTYHILLVHSCLQPTIGDISPILTFLDLMSSSGFPPDSSSTDLAIRALCSASREDDAAELLLRGLSLHPDPFTYNFLVGRLAKTRSLSAVYLFIDELRNVAGIHPDRITYTILIDSVCRCRNLREATRLLGVLKHSGIKPDCYLYNNIMKAYCMLDQCGEVMEVYNKMRDEGIEPDLVTYNTLIYGLSKAGMIDQAKKFLNVMANSGYFPDIATYTSLISGMCRKGDTLGALRLLGEMEEKGCSPNEFTYNALLMGLCKAGSLDKGMELYKVMTNGGMKLESPTYATFLRTLCRTNKIAEAYEVFDYARESKSLTDEVAYSTLESSLKRIK
ncbi:pentatricopeptide repeat-containing protein At2g17670 [Dendrobium catenatum]|uniref:Pentatricopeptide repeat-containing protein n=1 Tax=Dendrobium catenatum TaxID=906689 RepID=A0A2I0VM58_9ASPA|nr:pentatricopeptide repeat-containing protein At2g17670 [Dendrobium catenatum]XP_028556648.1 pentatricopeptide repeat-containing protein At2g17670 [Dendrobium catenatum]XP_028556649.1 pentatricopeptide repeat-containing protein At2g17670 [Dendrobium catenatum]PKU64495.1 Pentatricopeptide repeat-containing protein [Dendrobium catenatum]